MNFRPSSSPMVAEERRQTDEKDFQIFEAMMILNDYDLIRRGVLFIETTT